MDLHFIAPQFLAWFYPANGEIFHSVGMLAFGRDLLSPLLNLGWFVGCLVACWCIGRPYRVAPWSLGLGRDRAERSGARGSGGGGAQRHRRDLLPARRRRHRPQCMGGPRRRARGASATGALAGRRARGRSRGRHQAQLPPARVGSGRRVGRDRSARRARWRALAATGLAALAGGGYWYLRNLVHSGSPLPWVHHLGPISLPAPEQALGGREAHSVLGYLTDGAVWSDWFLPGLHHGLWFVWPVLAVGAFAGLVLCLDPRGRQLRGSKSADDAEKEPRNLGQRFGSNPRMTWKTPRKPGIAGPVWLRRPGRPGHGARLAGRPDLRLRPRGHAPRLRVRPPLPGAGTGPRPRPAADGALLRGLRLSGEGHPLNGRIASKATEPVGSALVRAGGAARRARHAVARGRRSATRSSATTCRAATRTRPSPPPASTPPSTGPTTSPTPASPPPAPASTRSSEPTSPTTSSSSAKRPPTAASRLRLPASAWRRELNAGHYDYVVTTRDRLEPGKPPYPEQARWTESPEARPILKKPPTVVFQLTGKLDPSACP